MCHPELAPNVGMQGKHTSATYWQPLCALLHKLAIEGFYSQSIVSKTTAGPANSQEQIMNTQGHLNHVVQD